MNKQDFLLEIGCEELPARFLQRLAKGLDHALKKAMTDANLHFNQTQYFATPRRLAVVVEGLDTEQAEQKKERHGPFIKDAYDQDGTPTLACIGFARSCGVPVDQLQREQTPKGERVCVSINVEGAATADLLPEVVQKALKQLPLPKPMRWGNSDLLFIRPVLWVLMLLGNTPISAEILGLKTTSETKGHRFHHPKSVLIPNPKAYASTLSEKAHVIVDIEQRKQKITHLIQQAAGKHTPIIEPDLLDEVTALVEWPVALIGQFSKDFLKLPKEVLITSMKTHQKTFPVEDANGQLEPYFVVVSNIESKDPQAVIKGNERVIQARLSDAKFFYENDLKQPLASHTKTLDGIVFQKKLGTIGDKVRRVIKLANFIAKHIEADVEMTKQAAQLAKCDLVTEMVFEFPNLQGIMGYYYALHNKASKKVATAIKEHYWPKFSGDALPSSKEACAVALADRIDTLVGIIGIKQMPTGDKDPFALRRAAQGVYRILIEKKLPLDLDKLIKHAVQSFPEALPNKAVDSQVFDFVMERMRYWYADQSIPTEVFESVLAAAAASPLDFHQRLEAVQKFIELPEAAALAAANKRVSNILKKQNKLEIPKKVSEKLLEAPAEQALSEKLLQQTDKVASLYEKSNYQSALTSLACLKAPVDQFFEDVMVMDKDEKKRNNRLALLKSLHELFTKVADIGLLTPVLDKQVEKA